MQNQKKTFFQRYSIPLLMGLAFIVWAFNFRGFLLGKLAFTSDAISYYEHTKFYIKSLAQGVYPMWDPFWNNGVPNEFFLRRIGSFNPFYGIILLLYKAGLSFFVSYVVFLSFYYFLGMIGFYRLSYRLFQDQRTAFFAFSMLLFSSLGTRLFDSYMLLFTVPIIWFFDYLVAFVQAPSRKNLLGIVFSFMIIFTTYIPFYFINIFISFFLCFLVFYFPNVMRFSQRIMQFVFNNKRFTALCVCLLFLSLLPGVRMLKEGKKKDFVLPHRSYTAQGDDTIQVGYETITSWGILEDLVYSDVYSRDLRRFKFAVVYVPISAFLMIFLGCMNAINKRMLFFLSWMMLLFLAHSPYFPFYRLLYTKVFYFKYFRNLHFYLWAGLMPIFILFAAEHFHQLVRSVCSRKISRVFWIAGLVLACGIILYKGNGLVTSYLTLVGTVVFFWMLPSKQEGKMTLPVLLLLCALQPLEVYGYLQKNYQNPPRDFGYDRLGDSFAYHHQVEPIDKEMIPSTREEMLSYKQNRLYYASGRFSFLDQNTYYPYFREYLSTQFLIYDNVEWINEASVDFALLEETWLNHGNRAYVSASAKEKIETIPLAKKQPAAIVPAQGDDTFLVQSFNANAITLKTHFDENKFLVYNDCFHPGWKAFINGTEVPLLTANVAFKGIYVPHGENCIEMRFVGNAGSRIFNYFYLLLFTGVLGALMVSETGTNPVSLLKKINR